MALLDVSEVISEPLFTEQAMLVQRAVVIGPGGIASHVETRTPILVIPTSGDGDQTRRSRDASSVYSTVRFYTKAQLSPGETGSDADRIHWRGRLYQVISRSDWSTWGQGFTSASCELVPPDGGTEGPEE